MLIGPGMDFLGGWGAVLGPYGGTHVRPSGGLKHPDLAKLGCLESNGMTQKQYETVYVKLYKLKLLHKQLLGSGEGQSCPKCVGQSANFGGQSHALFTLALFV